VDLAEHCLPLLHPHGGATGTAGEQHDREPAREAPRDHPHAFAAATFGAEFTGPLLPDDPDVELEPPLLLPVPPLPFVPVPLLADVEALPEEAEEEPSEVAAGLDSPPSDFGLLEE